MLRVRGQGIQAVPGSGPQRHLLLLPVARADVLGWGCHVARELGLGLGLGLGLKRHLLVNGNRQVEYDVPQQVNCKPLAWHDHLAVADDAQPAECNLCGGYTGGRLRRRRLHTERLNRGSYIWGGYKRSGSIGGGYIGGGYTRLRRWDAVGV